MTDGSKRHYEQALALQAEAEQGEPMYEMGSAEAVEIVDVPMTRRDKLLAANTHMLLAIYLKLESRR